MWQLKVYCLYNEGFDQFLKEVVQLILSKYGFQLNIESLKEIELVNKNTYSYETDGKVINNSKIIVTSRLYELLPILDIKALEDNINFTILKQTLFHEMGHINDMVLMPKLYKYAFSEDSNREQIASQFWLEYIAEKRTTIFEGFQSFDLCDEFVKEDWRCTMCSLDVNINSTNFAYLTKVLPYFMAATREISVREKYINEIRNILLIQYINELDLELKNLEKSYLFDDVTMLNNLYNTIDKYYRKFMLAFRKGYRIIKNCIYLKFVSTANILNRSYQMNVYKQSPSPNKAKCQLSTIYLNQSKWIIFT